MIWIFVASKLSLVKGRTWIKPHSTMTRKHGDWRATNFFDIIPNKKDKKANKGLRLHLKFGAGFFICINISIPLSKRYTCFCLKLFYTKWSNKYINLRVKHYILHYQIIILNVTLFQFFTHKRSVYNKKSYYTPINTRIDDFLC